MDRLSAAARGGKRGVVQKNKGPRPKYLDEKCEECGHPFVCHNVDATETPYCLGECDCAGFVARRAGKGRQPRAGAQRRKT